MKVQIDPAHQAVAAACHGVFAGAPGAAQLPMQTVRVDCIQLLECQHGYLRGLDVDREFRWLMLDDAQASVGDAAHAGPSAMASASRRAARDRTACCRT
jgi:hypothetical protein